MVGVGIAGCTAASALPQELRAGRGSLGLKERLEFFQAHTLPVSPSLTGSLAQGDSVEEEGPESDTCQFQRIFA